MSRPLHTLSRRLNKHCQNVPLPQQQSSSMMTQPKAVRPRPILMTHLKWRLLTLILKKSSVSAVFVPSCRLCWLPRLELLKKTWHLPIYSFFKPDVSVQYHNGHLTHFFPYTTLKCKMKAGGIRCFQDSKDKSLTANLKHHAINCFGAEAIDNTIKGKAGVAQSTSICSLFAHQGQQLVRYSHHTY